MSAQQPVPAPAGAHKPQVSPAPPPQAEYQLVPVDVAKQIATGFQKSVVVILCYDPTHQIVHTTTYGVAPIEKDLAAVWGEIATQAIGCDLAQKISYEDYRRVGASAAAELRAAQEQLAKLLASYCDATQILADIETCRGQEGESITIYHADPEADDIERQTAVELCASFNHHEPQRFYGRTWVDALHAAAEWVRAGGCWRRVKPPLTPPAPIKKSDRNFNGE